MIIIEKISTIFQSTVFQTVISATAIFILGEIIRDFFLIPIKNYQLTISKIDNRLKFYANVLHNDYTRARNEKLQQELIPALQEIRQLSCDLESTYKVIIGKRILKFFNLVPSEKSISDASSILIRVSNVGGTREGWDYLFEDEKSLREKLNIQKID